MSNPYSPASYDADGGTSDFPTTWKFLAASDLVVSVKALNDSEPTTQVLGADYTVTGAAADEPGGTVHFVAPPPADSVVTIARRTALIQPLSLAQSGNIGVKSLTAQLDREILIDQEQDYRLGALEALGSLVNITGANAVAVEASFLVADPVENTFPIVVAVPNGHLAKGLTAGFLEDNGDDEDMDNHRIAPSVRWHPGGGDSIVIDFISGLLPGNGDYTFHFLVFI